MKKIQLPKGILPIGLAILPLGFQSTMASAGTSLQVDPAAVAKIGGQNVTVQPQFFGLNLGFDTSDEQRERLVPLLKGKVRILRWPEGAKTQSYDYKHPSYAPYKDPRRAYDPKLEGDPANFTDVHEFIQFCKRIGAEPMIGVPLQGGFWPAFGDWNPEIAKNWKGGIGKGKTPVWRNYENGGPAKEAEDVVRELNQVRKYGVKYFYIDNEIGHTSSPFYYTFSRPITPEEKAPAYKEITEKMLEADPTIRILDNTINKGFNGWWSGRDTTPVHGYGWSNYLGSWDPLAPNSYQRDFEAKSFKDIKIGDLATTKSTFRSNGYPDALFVRYEWNISPTDESLLGPMEAGIWNAWNQLEQLKGGVDMSVFWPIYGQKRKQVSYLDEGYTQLSPSGQVVQMIAESFSREGDLILNVPASDSIYALGARNEAGSSVRLALINKKSTGAPEDVTLEVAGVSASSYSQIAAYQFQYSGASLDIRDPSFSNYRIAQVPVSSLGSNQLSLQAPPMSVTVLLLQNPVAQFPLTAATERGNVWRFILPSNTDVETINLSLDRFSPRSYDIYIRPEGLGNVVRKLITRRDVATDVTRNFAVEHLNEVAKEIVIVWRSDALPSQLGLAVNGKPVQRLVFPSNIISDEKSGAPDTPPAFAIDENWETIWRSNQPTLSHLRIHLSAIPVPKELSELLIRWDPGSEKLNYAMNVDVQVSDVVDRAPLWNEFRTVKSVSGGTGGDQYIHFDKPIQTRFIRLVLKNPPQGAQNFSIREIKLWGRPVIPTEAPSFVEAEDSTRAFHEWQQWNEKLSAAHSGGKALITREAGNQLTTFVSGSQIYLLVTEGPDRGMIKVTIDEGKPVVLDLLGSKFAPSVKRPVASALKPGVHRVVIEVLPSPRATENYVVIDAIGGQ